MKAPEEKTQPDTLEVDSLVSFYLKYAKFDTVSATASAATITAEIRNLNLEMKLKLFKKRLEFGTAGYVCVLITGLALA